MPFSTSSLNQELDALNGGTFSSLIAFGSLHSAYSATGTNELAGGGYAREAITWSAASATAKSAASVAAPFTVPAGSTVAFVGLWSASSSGTFGGMGPNDAGTLYAATCTNASPGVWTAPGSSYSNGSTVVLFNAAGATIPAAFTVGVIYFIVSAAGATFSLSATSGGSAINTAGAGAGLVQAITTESFGAAGTFTLSSEVLNAF